MRLAGTLTSPASVPPLGGVLLLSGCGPQDRDASIAGYRPFAALAAGLADAGLAVLRWDDRGVGGSDGDYHAIGAEELVGDLFRAIDAIAARLPARPLALAGHSQGAIIAARAAGRWPGRIDGLVLLAGMGRLGREVLADDPDCRSRPGLVEWERRFLLATDPAEDLRRVRCPVLALTGTRDVQTSAAVDLARIEAALSAGGNIAVTRQALDGVNHLFQIAETGSVSEYPELGPPWAGGAMELVCEWLAATLMARR